MSTSIAAILQGTNPNNIDLQVVKIHSPSASRNPSYYKLTLSDGQHTIIGVLHPSLSHLVKRSEIKEGSIIRLGNWAVSTVEKHNKRVLCLNSNVVVIGHERIKNSKLLVECPDVNVVVTQPDNIGDDSSIGPVYDGPETIPPPERLPEENWTDFIDNGLEYVKVVNDDCYLYIEAGTEPLIDVHAQLPARKVDVYAAVVVKMAQQSVGYCRGYTCSFGNTEGTIVAVVLLRSKRIIKLAVRDTTTGNIIFRTPSPGEIIRKQYRVTPAMSSSWKNHLEAATASVNAAKEKRATKLKPTRRAPLPAPVKSIESSESSESEVPITRSSKRKREVTVNPPAKRQRTEKQLFQLDDNLEDLDAPQQSVAYAANDDVIKLQQQLTRVNQQLSSQQNQIVELQDDINNKLSKIKELTAQFAALSEDVERTKTTLSKLSTKGSILTPVPAEATFQSPEKDGNHLINVTQRTNTTLLATIISDEIPILDIGRSGIHTFLIALSLVVDLLGTFWTGYQLRLYFNSPSTAAISRIALVLLLLGCIASTVERVLTILFLWLVMFDVNLLTAIFVIGAFFVVFAATFIALYWSTLVFPMKKRELESYKLFIPLLVFFSANAIVYMVMLGLGLNNSTVVLDAIFAVVLGLLAVYFIISGAVLIRTMTNYFKAAHSKGKAKRFQAALVLTGISLVLLLVSVALAVLDLYYTNQLYYWIIRTLINVLSVLSAAALALLFKDPSSEQSSAGGDTATQPTTLSTSTSPRSGENIELVTTN